MATDNQDNENNTTAPSLSKRGAARRRVTRAGVGAVGLLSTLSAHATLTPKMMCTSPSNWAQSMGVVNSHVPAPRCNGKKASDWYLSKTFPGGCTLNTRFSSVFYVNPTGASCPSRTDSAGRTVTNYQAGSFYCATFGDLLKGSQSCDSGVPKVGQEFVAAYLNIAQGNVGKGALALTDLQNIWYELQMKGLYHATATITWDANQVATYLRDHINVIG